MTPCPFLTMKSIESIIFIYSSATCRKREKLWKFSELKTQFDSFLRNIFNFGELLVAQILIKKKARF